MHIKLKKRQYEWLMQPNVKERRLWIKDAVLVAFLNIYFATECTLTSIHNT